MINMKQEMNRIILFFTIKHKGNWEKIYGSIKTKDPVTLTEMNALKNKYCDNYISIIDQDYPNNFKDIYMPPLSIFTIGQKNLLSKDDIIISLWGINDYSKIFEKKLDKNKVYALFYDDSQINCINQMLEQNYKLILIGKHTHDIKNLGNLNINNNVVYISEIPFEINKPDINSEQNDERNLLGISKHAICFDSSKQTLDRIMPLFKFEERKLEIYNEIIADSYINNPLITRYKKYTN